MNEFNLRRGKGGDVCLKLRPYIWLVYIESEI